MLQLRPICENCGKDLPPDSEEARICSYECTFCAACVEGVLLNVCPNCGGGFERRPIRPRNNWRPDTSVSADPPTSTRKLKHVDASAHLAFATAIKGVPPAKR